MSALVQHSAAVALRQTIPNTDWPACEDTVLPGDGSMRWLGMLLLGGTTLVTLRAIYWVGDIILTHL